MAGEQGARTLVLEATFSRMTDAAASMYPWLPVRLVMSNRYNSVKRIKNYTGPLFQCHGSHDEVVPIKLARRLLDSAPSQMKHFHEVHFGRHNDSQPPAYYSALAQFLDRVDEQSRPLTLPLRERKRQLVS
jgi:fermentation-respiration switch protein FrsA (DUF1100 family)